MNNGENVSMSIQSHERGNHMGGNVRPKAYMSRLYDLVPFGVQQDIWAGKYIDMRLLVTE